MCSFRCRDVVCGVDGLPRRSLAVVNEGVSMQTKEFPKHEVERHIRAAL